MTQRVRVVLAEDQSMLRGALAALLSIEPDIEVLGSFSDGEQALQAVGKYRPDVLVADIEMPKMTGLELTARVRELYPETRVLILTTFARPGYLRRALDAGASGYRTGTGEQRRERITRRKHDHLAAQPIILAECLLRLHLQKIHLRRGQRRHGDTVRGAQIGDSAHIRTIAQQHDRQR